LDSVGRFADHFSPPEPYAAKIRELSHTLSVSVKARAEHIAEEVIESRSLLPWLWLVPAIALLLISRSKWFRDSAVAHLPEGHLRWRGEEFFRQVNSILAGYVRAQILSCLLVGALSIAGFWLIGVPYALLLGTAAGILEFLPAVGPLSLAIAACSIVGDEQLLMLVAFLAALRLTQDYLIYPLLVGRRMHLHPVAIVLATLAGAQAGGMLGILAAIPFVGIASIGIRHWREYWLLENLVREHGGKEDSNGSAKET
jgi:predicted PurR-regulated permease PerM